MNIHDFTSGLGPVRRIEFDDIADLHRFSEQNADILGKSDKSNPGWDPRSVKAGHTDPSWYGHQTPKGTHDLLASGGDEKFASGVGDILSGIRLPDSSRMKTRPVMDVCGGVPIVPAVLAGVPDSMLDIQDRPDCRAPISVYVDVVSSCGIDAEHLRKRGACCIALLQILQTMRPVRLFAYAGLGATLMGSDPDRGACGITVPVQTPLSIAEAGLLFCSQGFSRGLLYAIGHSFAGFRHHWPFSRGGDATDSARAILQPEPGDIIVGGMDSYTDTYKDPVAWIMARLRETGIDTSELEGR